MNEKIKERIERIKNKSFPEGYKLIDSAIIPEDWILNKIVDTCPLQRGFDLTVDSVNEGHYPVCYSNGILRSHSEFKVKGPGVITGRSGTIGKVFYVEEKFWPHNTSLWVTDFKGNFPKFIYYLLTFIDLNKFSAGTGVPTLNRNDVHSFKVAIPPIPEQEKISIILSTWDKAIELKEQLIEEKKYQKSGLMKKLLTSEVRMPGFEGEWKEVRIGDLVEEVNRIEKWEDDKLYDLVSVRRRSEGLFHRDSLYGYKIATKNLTPIKEGDFLISKMQVVHGALSEVKKDFEGYYVSGSYIILNSRESKKFNIRFYHYLSNLPVMYRKALRSSYGVHIEKMTFNLKLYLGEKIYIPSDINEQNKIVQILDCLTEEIALLVNELETLKIQKKGLMKLLLTGIVRVQS
ncbi:restriction endonuclease subunit S [Desulfosporosinus lacus]|uniref:Type I restriction enzyme, S subunit n=1 Tax=Desulfosporosinus lacus DSM 15449 TaxID=1121420 RepID=A0A1M5QPC0_9FIRM|nr:restriction endonuclease subunit S [Desulfosporosinus lacus]SHH15934.1 type I restriction enzyme, S subunit [Desulfosporosinus lacus DSM 15449]